MTITQADIITILQTGNYPSSQKALKYYQQKQKYPFYPFVEVRKVQSDSNTTDVQKTTIDQTFEIRFYMKYTRPEAVEEADRLATENEILRVLETTDIEPTGTIYFESKQWNTGIIDDSIYGSKSTLRFSVKDIDSTSGSGLIGSGDQIELNSEATPLSIQILALTTKKGFSADMHNTDDRKVKYDPNNLIEFGEFTITYEQTTAIKTIIDGLSLSGDTNNGKITRGGVESNFSFLVGQTNTNGNYGEHEKATTVFYATGIWTI